MKRFIGLFIAVLMVMSMAPVAFAVEERAVATGDAAIVDTMMRMAGDVDSDVELARPEATIVVHPETCKAFLVDEYPSMSASAVDEFCSLDGVGFVRSCADLLVQSFPEIAPTKANGVCGRLGGLMHKAAAEDRVRKADAALFARPDAPIFVHPEACSAFLVEEYPSMSASAVDEFCSLDGVGFVRSCADLLVQSFPEIAPTKANGVCGRLAGHMHRALAQDRLNKVNAKNPDLLAGLPVEQQQRMAMLQERHLQRIAGLDDKQLERLAGLDQEQLRKLAAMDQEQLRKFAALDEQQLEKLSKLDRARLDELAKKSPEEIRSELSEYVVKRVKKEEAFRERAIGQDKAAAAQQRFEQAANRYVQQRQEFAEERSAFEQAVALGDEDAAVVHAKAYLSHAADMVIESLNKVRAKIEADDDLSEQEALAALEEIDARIALMDAAKVDVQAAQTKAEIKDAAKVVDRAWQRTRDRLMLRAEQLARNDVGEIISRSNALEARLDAVLAEMESSGVDVSDIDDRVDEFSVLVSEAREKFAASAELFKVAKDVNDREALEESKDLAREAHDLLKDAHEVLMDIVREVKSAGYSFEDDDDYVDVIEEESDDESDESDAVICCQAMTADCMACNAGESVLDYCEDHPQVAGCEAYAYDDDESGDDLDDEEDDA